MPIHREPILKALRNHLADAVGFGEVGRRGVDKRLHGVKTRGQRTGRCGANVADGQRHDDPPQLGVLRGVQVGQQFLAGGIDLTVLAGVCAGLLQVVLGEVEQARLVFQYAGGDEVCRALLPQRLDIEGAARGDVFQARRELRGARPGVGAAPVGVALLRGGELRAAHGAVFGVDELALGAVAQIGDRAEHLRDDLAGLAHHHRVADHHTLALDLVLVVQGGHGHR